MIRALVLLLFCPLALAAPKAVSPQECATYSDVAIVSRALVIEHIGKAQRARLYGAIYESVIIVSSDRADVLIEVMEAIDKAAANSKETPLVFAAGLFRTCNKNRGDMDAVLEIGT